MLIKLHKLRPWNGTVIAINDSGDQFFFQSACGSLHEGTTHVNYHKKGEVWQEKVPIGEIEGNFYLRGMNV